MSPRNLPDPKTLLALTLAGVALAGCGSTGALTTASVAPTQTAAPKPADPGKVDEVTRSILMAAGLDPSDPAKAHDVRRQVAAVVQVRYRGRTYGTALANPSPGKLAFVDPAAVANLLSGQAPHPQLARALKGPMVDVASESCRNDGRAARRTRKAFRQPRVCPAPSGEVWADLNQREMAVELHLAPQYAALVKAPADQGLAAPTLFAARPESESELPIPAEPKVIMADAPEPATVPARATVNLLAPDAVVAVAQPEPPAAAAPVSLTAPVVLPPAPAQAVQVQTVQTTQASASARQRPTPVLNALFGSAPETPAAPRPPAERQPVVLAAPAPQSEPAQQTPTPVPTVQASAQSGLVPATVTLQPTTYGYGRPASAETPESYAAASGVRVTDEAYRPLPSTSATKIFQNSRY